MPNPIDGCGFDSIDHFSPAKEHLDLMGQIIDGLILE